MLRTLRTVTSEQGPVVSIEGRSCLLFSSNNYLGIANHPALKSASMEAIEKFGLGAGASRLISGNHFLFEELERRLAQFKQTEAALLFNSGYLANLSALPALLKRGDMVLADRLCHASLIDGCRLSGARLRLFHHHDIDQLEGLLRRRPAGGGLLIVTDGVFSMEGDLAPLNDLVGLAERYEAYIYLDDAHATGVLGASGRGSLDHFAIGSHPRIIQMGTFSKALGSLGGYIAGARALIDYLTQRARGFIYTTALPPGIVAANLAALELVEQGPDRRARLSDLRDRVQTRLRELGFDTLGSRSPILPVLLGDPKSAILFSARLYDEGIFIPAIRPPTVPRGTSRLRISLMATHTDEQIAFLLSKIESISKELRV